MRLAFQLLVAGHLFEVGFGPHEEHEPEERVTLSGGPIGFALPEPDEDIDEEDEESARVGSLHRPR
ncbi:hypothetical protein [Micromonospora sp. GCM10011541]|uniref:hypothetical protein n=1 Tax=Micromonospora sp. GCM10011541 TaxID=3317336 RepID=UPI00361EE67F